VESVFLFLATLTEWGLTLYEWIIIIAILISWVNPDPRNPIVQFLNHMTVPLWNRLRGWLPAALRLFSAYISLLLVWFLKIFVPGVLRMLGDYSGGRLIFSQLPGITVGYFLLATGVVVQSLLFFLILLLLIWFFLTLINPSVNNPIVRVIFTLVDPFITPIQRRLPRRRVDLSPLLAAGIFLLVIFLLITPVVRFAVGLTQGGGIAGPLRLY
jgi:YggT family protein